MSRVATYPQIAALAAIISQRALELAEGKSLHPEKAEAVLVECIDQLHGWSFVDSLEAS